MIRKLNKLVRDRIPEIIEQSGRTCTTEILTAEEYIRSLEKKLDEELDEYHKDQSLEELADLMEVIRSLAVAKGYSVDELEAIRTSKVKERGAFEKRILLIDVHD